MHPRLLKGVYSRVGGEGESALVADVPYSEARPRDVEVLFVVKKPFRTLYNSPRRGITACACVTSTGEGLAVADEAIEAPGANAYNTPRLFYKVGVFVCKCFGFAFQD